jgi:hypothetical protein
VYFRDYVKNSIREFPVLGEEEYERRRTVNYAATVLKRWRDLIAEADSTVLLKQRKADPVNSER